jgi:PKD repeat protein
MFHLRTRLVRQGLAIFAVLFIGAGFAGPGLESHVASAETCGKTSDYLAVWEVQGSGDTSPYEGQRVSDLRGVVTADFQKGTGGPYEAWGFFLQAHETDCDSSTSDGVFVYTGSSSVNVSVGDLVEIDRADIDEYQGPDSFVWDDTLTEVVCYRGCAVSTVQSNYGLPPVEDYNPPTNDVDAQAYNEAREGMLMTVSVDSTVIAPVNPYNELVMLRGSGMDRLHHDDGSYGQRIIVDGDGVSSTSCGQEGLGYIKTFDTVAAGSAYGPLTYNFNTYKIHQDDDTNCLSITAGVDSSYDPADNPPPADDSVTLTVASFNAWNFFDTQDDNEKSDEVLTQTEFDLLSAKRAAAICNSSGLNLPLIIGLQEVENDVTLQKLTGDIKLICGVTYNYHTLAGPDDRSIEVAYLTRADRVNVISLNDRQGCSSTDWGVDYESGDHPPDVTCDGSTPYYLHNRVPLHLEAQITLDGSAQTVHVINNHFKSKLGSSACSTSDCTDWRVEEAQHVDTLVDNILINDPGAYIVVMGDLNDYYHSDPLDHLDSTYGVLTNVWSDLTSTSSGQGTITRYSYLYNGISQTLDHTLVSDALNGLPRVVSPRHVNADWPGSHTEDSSMFRSSDHDPLLVAFDFTGTGGSTDNPPSVNITNPADGATVSDVVSITADASDDNGVSQVEFFVDGGSIGVDGDGSDGWSVSWDTTTYADGSHTVEAVATDTASQTANDSISVTVENVFDPPNASFIYTCSGLTCDFDGSGSSDPDGSISSYAWGFGDGNTGSGVTVSHTYAAGGNYTVTLTVTDDEGATDSQSQDVTVSESVIGMHIGDLDGNSINNGSTWTAEVIITVHDGDHNPVADATVSGSWSGGASGTASCVTDANGQCTVSVSGIPKRNGTATFTVTDVFHADLSYDSSANHDPDGDSDGTSITIAKP